MTKTILPKKSNTENPFASDDEVHSMLTNDPNIQQFPQSNTFEAKNTSTDAVIAKNSEFSPTASTNFNTSNSVNSLNQQGQNMPQQNLTEGAKAAVEGGAESTVELDKDATDWINKKMRPMMGWIYMLTCTVDFVLFPVLWSILQALSKGNVTSQWQPLTLQGAGLYHIAMGAILGITAYGRTKEKLAGKT